MSAPRQELSATAAQLRQAFDRSFAAAPLAAEVAMASFLAVGVGGDAYAIDLADVSGLFADKAITRLPSAAPGFLGLAGFRGAMVPVYDLGVLLGYPAQEAPRWLVLAAAQPVALAFGAFEQHLRLPRALIVQDQGTEHARRHIRAVLRAADSARPIVDLASVLQAVRQRARPGTAQKEL